MPVFDPPAGSDIYVVPTVTVPPTSATSEALVTPGMAEPAATNRSTDVRIAVSGTLRQTATMNPTVVVKCMDLGQLPLNGSPLADSLERATVGGTTIDQLVADVRAGRNRSVIAGSTVRLAIRRYDYDRLNGPSYDDAGFLAVSSDFARWPSGSDEVSAIPPGESGTWNVLSEPRLVALPDASMLLVFSTRKSTMTDDGDIVVYRYDPASDANWQSLTYCNAATPHSVSFLVDSAINQFRPWQLAAWYDTTADAVWILVQGVNGITARTVILQLTGWTSATTAALSAHSTTFPTTLFANGITASFSRIAAAHTTTGTLLAIPAQHGLALARSSDVRTWEAVSGSTAGVGAFAAFAEWTRVYPSGGRSGRAFRRADARRIAASASDATVLWVATTTGKVLKSTDTGATWQTLNTPTTATRMLTRTPIALHDVAAHGSTVLAVGDRGVVLRSQDTGTTWSVIRYGDWPNATQVFDAEGLALTGGSTILPNRRYTRIVAYSATTFFLLGDKGLFARTTDAGETWTILIDNNGDGPYLDMVTDGTRAVVVGGSGVHSTIATASDRGKRGVFCNNVASGTFAIVGYHLDQSLLPGDLVSVTTRIVTDLTNAGTRVWVLSDAGATAKTSGNGTDNLASFAASAALPGVNSGRRIYIDPSNINAVFAFVSPSSGRNGIVYRSTNADASPPTFTAELAGSHRTGEAASDLYVSISGTTTLVAVGGEGILRSSARANFRVHPYLAVDPDRGDVWLATANLQLGEVEVWHATPPSVGELPAFERVDHAITFTAQADGYQSDEDYILRPALAFGDDGSLILTAGTTARIGLDRGREWVAGTDTRAALTVGTLATDADYTATNESLNSTRNTLAHAGRLWSVARRANGDAIATWVAWEWDSAGTQYRPVIPNKPMPAGVDSVLFSLSGQPSPGDYWTIAPRYGYRKEHLLEPTPSMLWRSTTIASAQEIIWDREHADIVAVLGPGTVWDVDTVCLFAVNAHGVYVALSIGPGDTTWSEVGGASDEIVAVSVTAPDGENPTNVLLLDSGTVLVEGQFNPSTVQYYAVVSGVTGGPITARVVRNGTNHLVLDRTVEDLLDATVAVFANCRVFSLARATGRYLRIRIPSHHSCADAFFQIGTVLAGRAIAAQTCGDGSAWQPVTNTTQDVTPSGAAYVTHYGRTGQLWRLQMPPHGSAARGRSLNHLLPRLRDPFVIAFGGDTTAPHLVRLVDAQQYRQALGQYWDADWVLQEVV